MERRTSRRWFYHEKHVATCSCCVQFEMGYEGDWSDMTPGRGAYVSCRKEHFGFYYEEISAEGYHAIQFSAQSCPDFEPRKTTKVQK